MKIAHVVDSMEVGGAETLVAQMCRKQREGGDAPAVFALDVLGPIGRQLCDEGFEVLSHLGGGLATGLLRITGALRRFGPDVVHLHNPTPTTYGALPARLAGAKKVISTRHSLVAPPIDRLAEFKYALAGRLCDHIVGICEATVRNLKSVQPGLAARTSCIYNGAAGLTLSVDAQGRTDNEEVLVFVGRLAPVKNLPLLVKAFARAADEASQLRLWIVGDGSERRALESLAAQLSLSRKVVFWGEQSDVAPFISAANALVMSSHSEGLPVSLLESFSLGVPAIVTDVGGMAEVVRLSGGGLVVPPGDSEQMAAAMVQLSVDEELRRRLSSLANAAFVEKFSLQTMVDAYMTLYDPRD